MSTNNSDELFISNNPFRLLGMDSMSPFASVRRKADQVSHQLAAGIPLSTSTDDGFGTEKLKDVVTITRALLGDTTKRTIHRIVWSQSDHLDFRGSWTDFLTHPQNVESLSEALRDIHTLLNSAEIAQPFVELISNEDEVPKDEAMRRLRDAMRVLAEYVITRSAQIAVDMGESGNTTALVGITVAILDSPLDDKIEEIGLSPIVQFGDRFLAKFDEVDLDVLLPNLEMSLKPFEALISAIGNRHPCTARWHEKVVALQSFPANRLRSQAIKLVNEKSEYVQALDVLDEALKIAPPGETTAQIQNDIAACHEAFALHLRGHAIDLVNKNNDFDQARQFLQQCLNIPLQAELMEKIREDLSTCNNLHASHLRNQAVDLANEKLDYHGALGLTKKALQIVDDSELGDRLTADVQKLKSLIAESRMGKVQGFGRKIAWGVGIVVVLIFVVNLFNSPAPPPTSGDSKSTPSSLTPSSSSSFSSDSTPEPYVPATTPSPDANRQILKDKYESMKVDIKTKDAELDAEGQAIETQRQELDSLRDKIDASRNSLDRTDTSAVDSFNETVEEYRSRQNHFNDRVNSYNSEIEKQKRAITRFNEIVAELNATR